MFLGMTQLGERKGNNLMQPKIETSESVIVKGEDFQDFMLPVNSPELMKLLVQSKYYGREPRDCVQLDDALVKLFQVAFEIDIRTCTEDEWTERISIKGGALKQPQSLIKDREEKEIENSRKAPLLFIALSALLLIGIGLLPKSPVSGLGSTVTTVTVPASASQTTQLYTVIEVRAAKSP